MTADIRAIMATLAMHALKAWVMGFGATFGVIHAMQIMWGR
jgi:hypothetical protein